MTRLEFSVDGGPMVGVLTQRYTTAQLTVFSASIDEWVEDCRSIAEIPGGELPQVRAAGGSVWFERQWKQQEDDLVPSFQIVVHQPTGQARPEAPNPDLLRAQELLKGILK
jgi:hypothetical protein